MAELVTTDRRALMLIKMHAVDRWKQPISGGAGSLVNTPVIEKVSTSQKLQIPFM
jgi:hypothetical protein